MLGKVGAATVSAVTQCAAGERFQDYRGALFDLDGTLIDSMWVWDHLCRDWLIEKGKTPEANLESDIALMTLSQSAEYVIRNYGFANPPFNSPAEVIAQWEGMALGRYETAVPVKQGMGELVKALYEGGTKLAVVTSCFPAACEAVLARRELRRYFSAIFYTHELAGEFPGDKSLPHIWLASAERLGLPPKDCVVFEDLYQALKGVRAAGMGGFAAVHDKTCSNWDAMKAEADWVIGPE
jgi:beta-phosphoglucomutase-like phosphatase (HAD superfamily)